MKQTSVWNFIVFLMIFGFLFILSDFLPVGFNTGVGITLLVSCLIVWLLIQGSETTAPPIQKEKESSIGVPSVPTMRSTEETAPIQPSREKPIERPKEPESNIPIKAIPYSVKIEQGGGRRGLYLQSLKNLGIEVTQDSDMPKGAQIYRIGKEIQYVKESKYHSESNHYWFGLYVNPLNAISNSNSYIVLLIEKGYGRPVGFDVIKIPIQEIVSRLKSFSLDTHDQYHINIEGRENPVILDVSGKPALPLNQFVSMRFRYPK